MKAILTDHAIQRAKERLSLREESLARLANKAITEGIKHAETNGKLKRFISGLWSEGHAINNARVWGEVIFLFRDRVLITLYQLPLEFRKVLSHYKRQKR
jgi:hypothetical protein